MSKEIIYLDYNATTPLHDHVLLNMTDLLLSWGNPSSIHLSSRSPKAILRETRKKIADYLKCSTLEIVFNSGASEGNNTVLKSVWSTYGFDNPFDHKIKNEFIVSQVEHPSVLKTMQYLETLGAVVHYIPITRTGEMDIQFIKSHLNEKSALVSVMMANNETGNVFPIKEIAALVKKNNTLMHTDCVQAFGKINFDFEDLQIDYATFSGHKFYALKGCGVLFVRKNSPYINLIHGGGQERSRRGGTENILAIASFGLMLDQLSEIEKQQLRILELRNYFENEILNKIHHVTLTGHDSARLPNTSSLVIKGCDGETLLVSLDIQGFAVSTGAACSSGNPEPSPTLLAMGLTKAEAQNSLRVSLGWMTTKEDIDLFITELIKIVARLRSLSTEEVLHV